MEHNVRQRLKGCFEFAGEPSRLPAVMVRVLMVGLGSLAALGVVDVVRTGTWDDMVQPAGAGLLLVWGAAMLVLGRPRPIPLILAAAIGAAGFIVVGAILDDGWVNLTSVPLLILSTSGLLAMAAGRRRAGPLAAFILLLTGLTVTLIHWDRPPLLILSQVGSSLIVMAIGLVLVRSIRTAFDLGADRYRGIFEASTIAFVEADLSMWNPDIPSTQSIQRMNPAAVDMLEDFRSITDEETIVSAAISMLSTIAERREPTGKVTIEVPTSEGIRSLYVSWNVMRSNPQHVVASLVDITDQQRAARALADQVAMKDRFIATVSHELRTPLTAVQGVLELLASAEIGDPDERDELTFLALSETRDMAGIIQDLLVLARRDNDDALVVNQLTTPMEPLIRTVTDTVTKHFEVQVEPGTTARCDGIRVRQILRNLMTNAVRYGGSQSWVRAWESEGTVTIEVCDDGPPIPPNIAAKMFEPYESGASDRPTGSIGLGLSVSQTLARLMGGDLRYHHDGSGSTFTLTLPAADTVIGAVAN